MQNRAVLIFVFFFAVLTVFGAAARAETDRTKDVQKEIEAGLDEALRLRFQEAIARFELLEKTLPDHPAGPFFQAYIYWWMMFEQGSTEPYCDRFQEKIDRVFSITRRKPASEDRNAEMHFYLGSAMALEARLKAMQRKNLAAAKEANKAKQVLKDCLGLSSECIDANLNIGLYNYIIDSLPASLKFLRALAFLSGGDKQKGLAQIRLAAENGHSFRGESRLALAALLLDREFRTSSAEGLRWIRALETDYPENLYFPTWEAIYFADNGVRPDKALSIAGRIKEQIDSGRGNYTPSLRRRVDYLYASVLVKRYRMREAVQILEYLQKDVSCPPPSITTASKVLLARLYDWLGERDKAVAVYKEVLALDRKTFPVSDSVVTFAQKKLAEDFSPEKSRLNLDTLEGKQLVFDGKYAEAVLFFQAGVEKYPGEVDVKLWLALSHFLGGDLAKANEILQSISGQDRQTDPALKAGAYLRLGQIFDLEGKRKEALALYKKVSQVQDSPRDLRLIAERYTRKPCAARELYPTDE